jgi:hypothetical protein
MRAGGKKLTPGDVSVFFSLAVGAVAATFIYHHQLGQLALAHGAWFGFLAFIHLRAKQAGGSFLGGPAKGHSYAAAAGYLLGLLLVSFAYVLPYE